MQGTAHQEAKLALSVAGLMDDANGGGAHVDRLRDGPGWDEGLAFLAVGQQGGTDPTLDVKWQEADPSASDPTTPDAATWADIAGAAHKQVLFDDNRIVTVVNLTNIAFTIAAQPANPSRVTIVIVDTTPSIVAGTVLIVGTRHADKEKGELEDQALSEIVDCAAGAGTYRTTGIFKTVASATAGVVAGVAGTVNFTVLGGAGDETIRIGVDNSSAAVPHVGRLLLRDRKRFLRAHRTKGGTTPTGGVAAGLVLLEAHHKPVHQVIPSEFSV